VDVVKLICFVKRNRALGAEEFHRRWREDHARRILDTPAAVKNVVRYEQNHRAVKDYERGGPELDGVAVQWFASMHDFVAMISDPEYQANVGPDEQELLDLDGLIVLFTDEEEVILDNRARQTRPATKLACLVKRKPGMSVDDFHRRWREVHGPLNRDIPSVARYFLRYEQNHRARKDYERAGGPDFDGAAIEWFPSARDFFAMTDEPAYHEIVAPDERNFLDVDGLVWILTDEEEVVIG
jgi:uncharacterized protein (TIGR02118 family)